MAAAATDGLVPRRPCAGCVCSDPTPTAYETAGHPGEAAGGSGEEAGDPRENRGGDNHSRNTVEAAGKVMTPLKENFSKKQRRGVNYRKFLPRVRQAEVEAGGEGE